MVTVIMFFEMIAVQQFGSESTWSGGSFVLDIDDDGEWVVLCW